MASVHTAQDIEEGYNTEISGTFTTLPFFSFLSGMSAGTILLFYAIKERERIPIAAVGAAFFCVSAADLIYAALYASPGHELSPLFKLGEALYLCFMGLILAFMLARYRVFKVFSALDLALFLGLFAIFGTLNYLYVLQPFFSRPETPDLLNVVLSTLYALTVSLLVPLLLIHGFTVNDLAHGLLFHILLLLNIVDFGIRYKTAFPAFSLPGWFENCWYACIIVLSALFLFLRRRIFSGAPKHVGIISLRGIYAASMLLAFVVYGIFLKNIGVYKFNDISLIVSILVAAYPVWVLANLTSLHMSRSISASNSRLLESMSGCFGQNTSANDCLSGVAAHTRISEFQDLARSYNRMMDSAKRLFREKAEAEKAASLALLSLQVAHDIRSPLAALGAATNSLEMPEEQRTLVKQSVSRIQHIADDLLKRYRAPDAEVRPLAESTSLTVLIEEVLTEKRLQYGNRQGVKIEFNGDSAATAVVDRREFPRIISNLVNNAVEALDKGGTVSVSLSALDGKALLTIKDSGKGIPPEVLAKLGQKGETHGKAGGTGLGLYHAKRTIEEWGGTLTINSEPGKGTAVVLELPLAERSAPPGVAVLLDDDPLVHMNWKTAAKACGVELRTCRTRVELKAVLPGLPKDTPIYMDSDLGEGEKGEDIAKTLRESGFTDLTMATGHGPETFSHLPWLKVTGKEPPWSTA